MTPTTTKPPVLPEGEDASARDAPTMLTEMAARVVAAHLTTTATESKDIPALLRMVHRELSELAGGEPDTIDATRSRMPVEAKSEGQVDPVRWPGVFRDRIVCLEDGRSITLLKTYVTRRHRMSIADYFRRWKLPPDYPMIPADYAASKRAIAQGWGLGVKVRARKERKGPAAV